jgi:hypothetical protein
MSQVMNCPVGQPTKLQLLYKEDSLGVPGLAARVALRDAITNKYLDFSDNLWKSSGWVQKFLSLGDFGNGIYHYSWNSWASIKEPRIVIGEYEITTVGYEAFDADIMVFGLTDMVESGRWKIMNNQMIFYGPDGLTPILTFDLFDLNGVPTMDAVMERKKA